MIAITDEPVTMKRARQLHRDQFYPSTPYEVPGKDINGKPMIFIKRKRMMTLNYIPFREWVRKTIKNPGSPKLEKICNTKEKEELKK